MVLKHYCLFCSNYLMLQNRIFCNKIAFLELRPAAPSASIKALNCLSLNIIVTLPIRTVTFKVFMQLHDHKGQRLYLSAKEREDFLDASKKAPREIRTFCFGVHAISKGVPLNMLSKLMGHSSLEMTAIYANALRMSLIYWREMCNASAAWEDLSFKAGKTSSFKIPPGCVGFLFISLQHFRYCNARQFHI